MREPIVLVTGAAGRIGGFLRRGLPDLGWRLRLLDTVAVPESGGAEVLRGDIRDEAVLRSATHGVAAVVHLAAISGEASFADISSVNIDGTYQVFEAARRARVPRIVYASSNHAVGFTPRTRLAGVDVPIRPDTYYGVSKAFGEALARYYVDRHGMRIAALRIGTCEERPPNPRALATWLSPGDMVRLTHACLTAPDLEYAVVYGVSANTRGWWDLEPGRALGYHPRDDAEDHAARVLAEHGGEPAPGDPDHDWLGGRFTTLSAPPDQRGDRRTDPPGGPGAAGSPA